MKPSIATILKGALVVCLSIFSFGCSSSSDSPSTTTSVAGVVMAGPASGTYVTVKTASGTIVAGPVTTKADGSYSIAIPNSSLSGDLIFEASGGTFSDEADLTATTVAMGQLTSHVAAGTLTSASNVAIDPSSTIIQKLIAGGKTKTAAESTFAAAFGYTPDNSIKPAFAAMSSASTTPQRLAGLRAAAFSQLTKDMGLLPANQFELINAIAADLLDNGTLDGGATVATKLLPADLANRFGQALVGFQMSVNNKSKLTPDKIGAPVFNKVALTDSYKVEFLPGMTAAAMGKTTFKIKITDPTGTTAVSGLTNVSLKPFMYMSSKSHTTPTVTVTESSTPGTYDCTIYYVMSTSMSGMSMGVWEVKVMIGTESATFYPDVAMNMGTTPLVKLLGVVDNTTPASPVYSDGIIGMTGVKETRTYFLFNDGITKEGMASTYTVNLFTATKEMMTDFPAVYNGKVLKDDYNTAITPSTWPVSSMTVEVSNDKTTWTPLTDSGNGHWTVAGIEPDMNNKIYVKLTVNGLQKTTDGAAVGAANGYQTITIVSGSGMPM